MIRMLDDKEIEIAEKQIERMKEELKHYEFLLKYNQLMIDEGCFWNYQEKLNVHKGAKKEMEMEISINNEKIKILQNQMENGVEIIEDRPMPGVG